MIKKRIIIVILILLLITGCSDEKCLESHEEQSRCIYYMHQKIGETYMMIPIYYDCVKKICDKYEE